MTPLCYLGSLDWEGLVCVYVWWVRGVDSIRFEFGSFIFLDKGVSCAWWVLGKSR